MTVAYVEREQADAMTNAFYDKAEDRFKALLNIFKVLGHTPELGVAFTDLIMAILKDGNIDWVTKELLILKATQRNDCQYCVVQHERLSVMLGIPEEKIADIDGDNYKTSPHFTEGERALLDLTVQIGVDANRLSKDLWDRLHKHYSDAQIVEAAFVIATYIFVSKFGDAMGVVLEPMFDGVEPILHINHSVRAMATIEIFSAPNCGYCRRTKALLEARGLAYRELDIAADPAQLEELRRRLPRSNAIPQIFIDGDHIGGYEDLCLLDERGKLDALGG